MKISALLVPSLPTTRCARETARHRAETLQRAPARRTFTTSGAGVGESGANSFVPGRPSRCEALESEVLRNKSWIGCLRTGTNIHGEEGRNISLSNGRFTRRANNSDFQNLVNPKSEVFPGHVGQITDLVCSPGPHEGTFRGRHET